MKINQNLEDAQKLKKASTSEIKSKIDEIPSYPIVEQNSVFDCITINVDFTKNIQFPVIEFKSN